MIDVLERISQLQKQRGWSSYRLAEESTVNQSTILNMFARKTLPSLTTLDLICEAFGITLSEFFAESESSKDEAVILGRWRQLNERDKRMLSSLADAMIREK